MKKPPASAASPDQPDVAVRGRLLDLKYILDPTTWREFWRELIILGLFPLYPFLLKASVRSYHHFSHFPTAPQFEVLSLNDLGAERLEILQPLFRLYEAQIDTSFQGNGMVRVLVWKPGASTSSCELGLTLPAVNPLLQSPQAYRFDPEFYTSVLTRQNLTKGAIKVNAPELADDEGIAIFVLTGAADVPTSLLSQGSLPATTTGDRFKWIW